MPPSPVLILLQASEGTSLFRGAESGEEGCRRLGSCQAPCGTSVADCALTERSLPIRSHVGMWPRAQNLVSLGLRELDGK